MRGQSTVNEIRPSFECFDLAADDHDMNEERESDDVMMYRPRWRCIFWCGWNLLALGWIGVGVVVGLVTNLVCQSWLSWLRDVQLTGTVAVAVGVSVILADLICRWRDLEPTGWRRYFSPFAGGAVVFVPAWVLGLWIAATGMVVLVGKA